MKKRILALLLVIMTLCPLIVACGSGYYGYESYADMIILGDVAKIEIKESDIENSILGTYYDYFSDEISASTLTSTSVTSGAVKYGDTVNIDYKGYKYKEDGTYETTPFEGGSTYSDDGTASGSDLELGSGTFIEGFESGLIGHEIGETVSLYLTFPETYSSTELAGKKVRFDVVINKVTTRYAYPEMTDEKIKEQSGGEYETVDAFKKQAREDAIKNLIWSKFYELCKIKTWPEKELKDYYYTSLDEAKLNAAYLGGNLDTYATYYGYTNGTELRAALMSQARQQCKQDVMILAYIEANNLTMSEADLDTAMRDIYEEAKAEGYEGSYKKYLEDNDESAVRIAAYTDVVIESLVSKVTPLQITGKNGIYGTAANGIYYYKNDVMQTGWHTIDFENDGITDGTYYFNEAEGALKGQAYNNIAVYMKPQGEDTEKYLEFGEKGLYKGVVDDKVVFVKLTDNADDFGGYAYIKNNTPQTGLQKIDRTGTIDGEEQYLFGNDGYMYQYAKKLLAADFDGLDFGDYEGMFYNFGADGVFNFDFNTKTNGKYGEYSTNGLANGIIADSVVKDGELVYVNKAYNDGEQVINGEYKETQNDTTAYYYFDENGEMVISKIVAYANGDLYYFDNAGKMLTSGDKESTEQVFLGITYTIGKDGKVTSAKYFIDDVAAKDYLYSNNGHIYYFDSETGEMARNTIVENILLGELRGDCYFNAYGQLVKGPTTITYNETQYNIDENGFATPVVTD